MLVNSSGSFGSPMERAASFVLGSLLLAELDFCSPVGGFTAEQLLLKLRMPLTKNSCELEC